MDSIIEISFSRCACQMISAVNYHVIRDDDPYRHFTGVGDSISISPDDQTIIFSYYVNGKQSIYKADIDGKNVSRIVVSKDEQLQRPVFANDGKHMLYLAKSANGVNELYVADENGREVKKVGPADMHVAAAAFAPDSKQTYYVGMDAKAYSKLYETGAENEGAPQEDFDIYVVALDGGHNERLTTRHGFALSDLQVSTDGKLLYYSSFNGEKQEVHVLEPFPVGQCSVFSICKS
ncbi:TolB family protein [Virgibacillus halophilus]|uniref:WD40-like Beta Propeller Repeat n=1 Tax=Tigheibacillus halophilus TaxID=361280 RepID=A0ABU5CBA8_9BACI|nr:hypothetical protein [Virgibacillus halophilus]